MFYPLFMKMGKPADTVVHFKSRIETAGFINIQQQRYEVPLGGLAKEPGHEGGRKLLEDAVFGGLGWLCVYVASISWILQEADFDLALF